MFIRSDLTHPQMIVQSCHGVSSAARNGLFSCASEEPHLVLIGVDDENALSRISCRLQSLGIKHASFREPDKNNELTSICTEPVWGESRHHFKKYQCLKEGAQP